jgi:hypothetical protein
MSDHLYGSVDLAAVDDCRQEPRLEAALAASRLDRRLVAEAEIKKAARWTRCLHLTCSTDDGLQAENLPLLEWYDRRW